MLYVMDKQANQCRVIPLITIKNTSKTQWRNHLNRRPEWIFSADSLYYWQLWSISSFEKLWNDCCMDDWLIGIHVTISEQASSIIHSVCAFWPPPLSSSEYRAVLLTSLTDYFLSSLDVKVLIGFSQLLINIYSIPADHSPDHTISIWFNLLLFIWQCPKIQK